MVGPATDISSENEEIVENDCEIPEPEVFPVVEMLAQHNLRLAKRHDIVVAGFEPKENKATDTTAED